MTTPLERARQLIALATGPTTPAEEARTAAMALAKLVAKSGLLDERGSVFDGVKPAQHCAGCLCFSNTLCTCDRAGCRMHDRPDRGHPARPRPPSAPTPPRPTAADRTGEYDFWSDAFHEPKSAEKKRYEEVWDRIWGEQSGACTCATYTFVANGKPIGQPGRMTNPTCPVHGDGARR